MSVNQLVRKGGTDLREITISVRIPKGFEPAGGWETEEMEGDVRPAKFGDLYLASDCVLRWENQNPSRGSYLILRECSKAS